MNKLNGRKVIRLKIVTWYDHHSWNYGGFNRHRGVEYRAGAVEGCHQRGEYGYVPTLVYGVQRFMWVYEPHPKGSSYWWRVKDITPQLSKGGI